MCFAQVSGVGWHLERGLGSCVQPPAWEPLNTSPQRAARELLAGSLILEAPRIPFQTAVLSLHAHSPSPWEGPWGQTGALASPVLVVTSMGLCGHGDPSVPQAEKCPQADVPMEQLQMPPSSGANSVPGTLTYIALFNPQKAPANHTPNKSPVSRPSQNIQSLTS